MADSQPPEGLQPRALIFRALRKLFHALGERGWVGHSTIASDCHSCNSATDAVLAEIEASGRLLPSGGEVSTQYGCRVVDDLQGEKVIPNGSPWGATLDVSYHQRIYATRGTYGGRAELVSREIHTGPWSPVLSDNSEVPNGD